MARFPKRPRALSGPIDRRLALGALVVAMAGLWSAADGFAHTHRFVINRSQSLPNWAFLVEAGTLPQRGETMFFAAPRGPLIVRHFGAKPYLFGKYAYGLPGDRVERIGGAVFVHPADGAPARLVARLKPFTRLGEKLLPGPTGTIPRRCYYAGTPHKDGFDSRYAAIGFVCAKAIYGVARGTVL